MAYLSLCTCSGASIAYTDSPSRRNGRFQNAIPRQSLGLARTLAIGWRVLTRKPDTTVPRTAIPVQTLSATALASAPDASLFRLGHSTLLMKLGGELWLTEPVFSKRASPVQ